MPPHPPSHTPPRPADADQARLRFSCMVLALSLTLIVTGLSAWEYWEARSLALEMARIECRASFNKDLVYRRWASGHGGVYVPVSETTTPNPYLGDIVERDISTPSGRMLTLMNPAYMTRQVLEMAKKQYGAQGHITSLNPLRPENAPDAWEAKALSDFETGTAEVMEVARYETEPYMRLIRPLNTEAGCLKCHGRQGYKVGDIRGGISVSVPLTPYLKATFSHASTVFWGYGTLWAIGMAGLWLAKDRFQRTLVTRHQAEDDLRASEARYRNLFENNYSVMLVIDPENGDIVDVNPAASAFYGWTREELTRKRITELNTLTPEEIAAEMHRAQAQTSSYFTFQHRLADGTVREVEVYSGPLQTVGKTLLFSIVHDITERRQAEKALRDHEEFLRETQTVAGLGTYDLDLGSGQWQSSEILDAIFGINRHFDRTLEGWRSLLHPEDRHLMKEYLTTEVIGKRQNFDREYRIIRPLDRSERWLHCLGRLEFNADGRPAKMIGTVQDITARKQADMALHASEGRYRQAVENSPNPIFSIDRSGLIQSWNAACHRFFQYEGREVIGQPLAQILWDSADRAAIDAALAAVWQGNSCENQEMAYRSQDNTQHFALTRIYPVFDEHGVAQSCVFASTDITARKLAEDSLRRSLLEKEVLLKEIHHRVKNNMQVIYSLQNLQANSTSDSTVRAMFAESKNRINAMSLIHEKLYSSKDFASVDFMGYLQGLVAVIVATYQRQDITVSVEMAPLTLDVNSGIPCGLIVNELLSNCLKHAFPEGRKGTVTLGISRDSAGNNVLSVADDGIGFPAEVDFRSTQSLGLRLVNVLAGQLHGTIELQSGGAGTRFCLTFPRPDNEQLMA